MLALATSSLSLMLVSPVSSSSYCPLCLIHPPLALMQDNSFYDDLVIHSGVEGVGIGRVGGVVVADGRL